MTLVGIAGGTCSGKSTLLKNLKDELGDNISTLSFDEYFIGSDLYNLDDITNFEDPKLYNFGGFVRDLKTIKQGKTLVIRANSRESSELGVKEKTIAAKPIVIVEGWLVFHNPDARKLFDEKIFIEVSNEEIIKRRYARTKRSKHWDDHDYIKNKILPGHQKYVEPQREFADLVLDGMLPEKVLVGRVINFLGSSPSS